MSDSFQLAIESSAARASVALARGGKIVFSREVEAGRRQSEVLMGPLRAALAERVGGRITLVVVGTGPGSYNGARVGIAAAQGVGIVHGCPVVGISSLEALGTVRAGGRCLAVGDARRGTFFTLKIHDGKLSGGPELLEHSPFVEAVRMAVEEEVKLVTLEDAERLKLPEALAQRVEWAAPGAPLLLEAWWARSEGERETAGVIPPEPFYLRPPHITTPASGG